MKKIVIPFVLLFMVLAMVSSCVSTKDVPYMKNADVVDFTSSRGLYDAKIMPKDLLTITVSTLNADASAPFNFGSLPSSNQGNSNSAINQGYLVDNNGDIEFPLVGKIHVEGLTKTQCQDIIREKILPYLAKTERPLVSVRMSSYRVTVLGEVGHPGVIPVTSEKMSILEALAQAGDLTIYGVRNNVMLIREDQFGQKSIHRLNLNDANIINSPYYYLQQNDIIYVEPNKVKAKSSDVGASTTMIFSIVGLLTSFATLVVSILRR
ncbi:MAG: polysaccharide biosynthesis/export family protein [Prevotella sp.]